MQDQPPRTSTRPPHPPHPTRCPYRTPGTQASQRVSLPHLVVKIHQYRERFRRKDQFRNMEGGYKMRVLVIGSGAREHALAWKLAQCQRVTKVYAAPGNPGMLDCAECVPISIDAANFTQLADFAEREQIDLTVVGPEAPLVDGLADVLRERRLRVFGPGAAGAALEGSKAFAKQLMTGAGIPTAQHHTFTDAQAAFAYLEEHGAPVVVKADGNAAGKGAIVALDMHSARDVVRQMMVERVFGAAGDVVVIEDYLQGDEIGSTALCHGTHYLPLTLTQDHKRVLDNDQGQGEIVRALTE